MKITRGSFLRKSLFSVLVWGVLWSIPSSALAQSSAIIATVNNDAITQYDVEMRTKLSLLSAKVPNTKEARAYFEKQALQSLIEERLQLQQAATEKIDIDAKDLEAAFAQLEGQYKLPQGRLKALLTENSIPLSVMEQQIRASLTWSELIRRKFGNRVVVSDSEVDSILGRISANKGQQEYHLYEIFLSDARGNAAVRADQIFSQLRTGGNFPTLAQQFSDSATGTLGGEKGWITAAELEKPLDVAITQMQVGQLSRPLKTAEGYKIVYLRDVRTVGGTTAVSTGTVVLYQTLIPTDNKTTPQNAFIIAQNIRDKITSCSNAEIIAKEAGLTRSGNLGTLSLRDLPQLIQQAVMNTDIGQTSTPLFIDNNYQLLTVCDKKVQTTATTKGAAPAIDPEKVRQRLRLQKLERFAESYLRQVRENAFIDIKIASSK